MMEPMLNELRQKAETAPKRLRREPFVDTCSHGSLPLHLLVERGWPKSTPKGELLSGRT